MSPERSRLPGWVGNAALAAGALLFVFALLEGAVRLFVNVREFAPIGIHGVDPDDPTRFLPHFERRYTSAEFDYLVSFNARGRRDIEWDEATIADPENWLFVGDSFVLGNGVNHEDTIPSRLEDWSAERGRPREVFNFGMPAGGPNTYLLLLERALDEGFAARTLVVGVFVGNDFYPQVLDERPLETTRAEKKKGKKRAGPRSQLLRFLWLRLSTSPRVVGWALTWGPRLGVDVYDTAGSYIFLREPSPDQERVFRGVLAFFDRMQDLTRRHQRELRLVVFPNRIQVENREDLTSRVFDAERPNRRIVEYAEALGVPCLDLLPVLTERYQSEGEPLYFPIDRHLNERGTGVAAAAIGSFLEETGAL